MALSGQTNGARDYLLWGQQRTSVDFDPRMVFTSRVREDRGDERRYFHSNKSKFPFPINVGRNPDLSE